MVSGVVARRKQVAHGITTPKLSGQRMSFFILLLFFFDSVFVVIKSSHRKERKKTQDGIETKGTREILNVRPLLQCSYTIISSTTQNIFFFLIIIDTCTIECCHSKIFIKDAYSLQSCTELFTQFAML